MLGFATVAAPNSPAFFLTHDHHFLIENDFQMHHSDRELRDALAVRLHRSTRSDSSNQGGHHHFEWTGSLDDRRPPCAWSLMPLNPPRHSSKSCHSSRLAESSVAAVDACTCGSVQLHMAAVTIRLTPAATYELLETLQNAINEAERRHALQTTQTQDYHSLFGLKQGGNA